MYQALDGRLIELVTTIVELLLEWPKGSHSRLLEVQFPTLFHNNIILGLWLLAV